MISWIILAVLAAPVVYLLLLHHFSYWKRHGIAQLGPSFVFGDVGQFIRQQHCIGVMCSKLYEISKNLPYVGIYVSFRPGMLINDPQMIKDITVRDFEHFHDRGLHVNEEKDPLSCHLFALGGEKWKHHRSKLSPTFTSGRLKEMLPIMMDVGKVLQKHIEKRAAVEKVIDMREVMARYTTDIIASVGFGIKIDSINNHEDIFRQMGTRVFSTSLKNSLRLASTFFTPKLNSVLGFKFIDQEVEDFMINVVKDTLEHRESNNVIRKDMMQLLLQLRNLGTVSIDERWDIGVPNSHKQLSLEQVTAHAFVFFTAAYETSSTAMSFCLHELAKNKTIQHKVQKEIDHVLSQSGGNLTYDNLAEMKYLESCIDETLRKYPSVPFLNRECTKEYPIPGTNVTIPKGTPIIIPVMGLHNDPNFFPEPEKFVPERFSDEKQATSKAYIPFGTGPRNCIGMRMGKIQTKVGLVSLLSKFNFDLADEGQMNKELKLDPRSLILMPVGGINLTITKKIDSRE
ncbi:probable cytochrome P450 6d4 [Topomyia yanbarensis]|uniref:probable cytochrome P450 6d4 n=1 Tax=Topomyia yanbarensis TaxID=2498891 RepID=UPI00273B61E3|nr:probable cytochrome P450 6d4 [Topomyia yanbarensis]